MGQLVCLSVHPWNLLWIFVKYQGMYHHVFGDLRLTVIQSDLISLLFTRSIAVYGAEYIYASQRISVSILNTLWALSCAKHRPDCYFCEEDISLNYRTVRYSWRFLVRVTTGNGKASQSVQHFRLKYLNKNWMNWHYILYRCSGFPADELVVPWLFI